MYLLRELQLHTGAPCTPNDTAEIPDLVGIADDVDMATLGQDRGRIVAYGEYYRVALNGEGLTCLVLQYDLAVADLGE